MGDPSFVKSKPKTNRVRFPSGLINLNEQLKRKQHSMPKINQMLLQLKGFKHAELLDLNMGYYHIQLNEDASDLCTILISWGKYYYKRLPMEVSKSPEIF